MEHGVIYVAEIPPIWVLTLSHSAARWGSGTGKPWRMAPSPNIRRTWFDPCVLKPGMKRPWSKQPNFLASYDKGGMRGTISQSAYAARVPFISTRQGGVSFPPSALPFTYHSRLPPSLCLSPTRLKLNHNLLQTTPCRPWDSRVHLAPVSHETKPSGSRYKVRLRARVASRVTSAITGKKK